MKSMDYMYSGRMVKTGQYLMSVVRQLAFLGISSLSL
jgi:hypothetical protein